jgi:SagB-type dehydrogenase family enzyme
MSGQAFSLSRFAFLRRDDSRIVLESPKGKAQIVVHDWRVIALLWWISNPSEMSATERPMGRLPAAVERSVLDLLWSLGFLTTPTKNGNDVPEEEGPALLHWEFHDLLFHVRSRFGRHRSPYGATFRLKGRVVEPPAIKPRTSDQTISLDRPNIAQLEQMDWPLTRALEARRSQRKHGSVSITRRQLGEFLYRTAGLRSIKAKRGGATTCRVYPSGGRTYALELYLAVRTCDGLEPGLYRYCPSNHDLEPVARMTPDVRALLADAARAVRAGLPQVLIIVAARFLRVSWKYSSVSYALILKEVGILMQTMYLVATAMGLAACAIGGGDSDLFARAAGTNYYVEGSIGEFILGRAPRSGA